MGHYIIVDRVTTYAIAIQDALEQGGHSAEIFQDPLDALANLVEFGADVLLLDLGIADEEHLVGIFRGMPETRSLPIVGLAETMSSEYVIEVLQLGLTDVQSRKLPLDELVERITRSTARPTMELPLFQGRLADRQLIDFLEYLRHVGKSGTLRITGTGGAGRIDILHGAISDARFKNLRGQAAVLAMLDQDSGRFKLGPASREAPSDPASRIDMQSVLLRATWLSDELAEHRQWVPRPGHELELVSMPSPKDLGDSWQSLPFSPILSRAQSEPFVRLHELSRDISSPPQELRLALAVLCRMGHLRHRAMDELLSTKELSSYLGIEYSIVELLLRAQQMGHTGRSLSLLLFAEPDVWPNLKALFLDLSASPFDQLARTLTSQDRGSVTVENEAGKLVLHIHKLDPSMAGNVKAVVSACDGLLLWLGQASDTDLLTDLIQRIRNTRNAVRGVVVTSDPGSIEWSRAALDSRPEWTLSFRPPSRLSSLLRSFYTRVRRPESVPVGGS